MPYRLVVLLSSIALAAVFAVIGRYLYWQTDNYFEVALASDGARLHSVYTVQSEALGWRTQALAHSIATNTEIQRLLDEGNAAVRAEGGRGGGKRAAHARQALLEYAKQLWSELHVQYEVQHLHFILPDGTSFLRVEAPSVFGDSLLTARPMLADAVRDQHPRSGFEIGYAYTGVLGTAAVMRAMSGGGSRHVGIVEMGLDMGEQIKRLDRRFDIGIALLLDNERVSSAMLESHRPATKPHQDFLLAASRPEAGDWLEAGLLPAEKRVLLDWQGRHFQVIAFALDDYQSQRDYRSKPPGTVLLWHDVTSRVERLAVEHTADIHGTLVAYAAAQCVLLLLLHVSRREWGRHLKQSTTVIENLSRHNALLLNTAADGICGVDRDGNITFINRAALAMHGYRREEVMGKNPHYLFHHHSPDGGEYPIENCLFMQSLKDGEMREGEEWLFRRDGSCFLAKIVITPIHEQGRQNGAVVVFHDITEQRNRQEALLKLATTDSLTGASNRRYFLDQLDAELARQRRHGGRASLLMSDLDFFKRINDTYGHAAGDAVLVHFVRTIRQTVRRSDIVGRMGGEEFAVLLPGDGIEGARGLAERLRRAFESNPAGIGSTLIPATVSIGVSELRAEDMNAEAPLHRADEALYSAKEAGRNRIALYDPNWTRSEVPKAQGCGKAAGSG